MEATAPCVVRAILLVLLLPLASAQLHADPAGDVQAEVYEAASTGIPGYGPADLRALTIEETPSHLRWSVQVESLDTSQMQYDGGDLRSHFSYGEHRFMVQMGTDLGGQHYAFLHQKVGDRSDNFTVGTLGDVPWEKDGTTLTAILPRELIVDHTGSPPVGGRMLTDIWVNSYSQTSFGGPTPDLQDQQDLLTVRDDMPDDRLAGAKTFTFQYGGSETQGPVDIWSVNPYRASNGGAATITYAVALRNNDSAAHAFAISAQQVPLGWKVHVPNSTLDVEAGETRVFRVTVETPSGHQHGGAERFFVTARDGDVWAKMELGIHYLAIPQPTGHHPQVWFHSTPALTHTGPLHQVLGNQDGQVIMNAVEEYAGDGDVPIQGRRIDGGYEWTICLSPELRMGLDLNASKTGTVSAALGAEIPYAAVSLSAELQWVAPGYPPPCSPFGGRSPYESTTIASGSSDPQEVGASTLFEFDLTTSGHYIPFQAGARLLLILEAKHDMPNIPGPAGIKLQPGGSAILPLDEFYDERPGGLVGGQIDETGNVTAPAPVTPTAAKESPAGSLLLALMLVALGGRRALRT